jgi:diguanylate cyclase (GGDEF)-like protein
MHGGQQPEKPAQPTSQVVLVMNHNRDPLDELVTALASNGYEVRLGESLAQSYRIAGEERPDVVLLNPLVLCEGGVELELLERIQAEDDPIPVILLVDDLAALADARNLAVPFRDFVLKPCSSAECVHRVELALQTRSRIRGLQTRARQLESQVSVDFKTGLTSELYMKKIMGLEWKRAQRHQNPLSLLLIDVDNFKGVNDTTEYAFGDEVLRRVADALKANVRETDFAARFGGDEFCVLLPQTSPAEAVQTALRIRQRISGMTVRSGNFERQVTVSIGVDSYDGRKASSVDHLRRHANRALHEAKRRGKNQVWLYSGSEVRGLEAEASGAGGSGDGGSGSGGSGSGSPGFGGDAAGPSAAGHADASSSQGSVSDTRFPTDPIVDPDLHTGESAAEE